MNKITYKESSDGVVAVYLAGVRVGAIYPVKHGFQYRAGMHRGQVFETISGVMHSLEEGE